MSARIDPHVVRDALFRARAIVVQGWCKGAPARDRDARPLLDPCDRGAERRSMLGAIDVAMHELRDRIHVGAAESPRTSAAARAVAHVLARAIRKDASKTDAVRICADWNDREETSIDAVIKKFTDALALLHREQREQREQQFDTGT